MGKLLDWCLLISSVVGAIRARWFFGGHEIGSKMVKRVEGRVWFSGGREERDLCFHDCCVKGAGV
jgi:hypothetical protein